MKSRNVASIKDRVIGRHHLQVFFVLASLLASLVAVTPSADAVVGGQNASQEYPHMAAFLEDGNQICGASLIAPEWILSAAHCVGELDPAHYSFVLGRDHLDDGGGETIQASQVIVHPDYASTGVHDVSLFRLERPSAYAPIRLADPDADRDLWEPGDPARVIGYGGQAFPGLLADGQLREVDVPIVDDADCDASYDPTFGGIDENTEVCAGELHGTKDSCQGDSGGPLMVPDEQGTYLQVGVVSWGLGCAFPTQYGVYSRVGDRILYDWIQATMAGTEPPPPPPPTTTKTVRVGQGTIAGMAPLSEGLGITETELSLACSADLMTEGVDGYVWALPEDLAVPDAVAQVTGGGSPIGHDLDIGFYGLVDGLCMRLGGSATGTVDESASVPEGTQFVIAHAWAGVGTVVDLSVEVPDVPEAVATDIELIEPPGSGTFEETIDLSARLTDASGSPLSDMPVRFDLLNENDEVIQFAPGTPTDDEGLSSAQLTIGAPAGRYALRVSFMGAPDEYAPSSAESAFDVSEAATSLVVQADGVGKNKRAIATLTGSASGAPVEGRTISFFADCNLIGEATTDESGTASVDVPARYRGATVDVSALFDGDRGDERYYAASHAGAACP